MVEKTKTKQKPKKSFSSSKDKKEKKKFLDCVFLTEDEHQKLIDKNGIEITTKAIEVINNYKMSSGRNRQKDIVLKEVQLAKNYLMRYALSAIKIQSKAKKDHVRNALTNMRKTAENSRLKEE